MTYPSASSFIKVFSTLCALTVGAPTLLHAHTTVKPTRTSLTLSPEPTVDFRGVITMVANVNTSTGVPVQTGLVLFCNGSAPRCFQGTEIGRAQLTAAGTAVYKTRLAPGTHSIYAVFEGTQAHQGSTSQTETTSVAPALSLPTSTALTTNFSQRDGTTALTGTVNTEGTSPATGAVSFLNESVMPNTKIGTATLGSPSFHFPPTGTPFLKVAADFNQDGFPDLLTVGNQFADQEYLYAKLGDGKGGLLKDRTSEFHSSCVANSASVADFNGDGFPDVVALACHDNIAFSLLGDGAGNIHLKSYVRLPLSVTNDIPDIGPLSVAVGDFNGDGIPDLAVTQLFASINILLGNGDGTFTPAPRSSGPTFQGYFLVSADFNGDGLADLAVTNYNVHIGSPGEILFGPQILQIYLSNGDGTFTLASTYGPYDVPGQAAFGDFNGDGITDLAMPTRDFLTVLQGKGDGTFSETAYKTGDLAFWVNVGDFNGDGFADLLVLDATANAMFLGNGTGEFTHLDVQGIGAFASNYGMPMVMNLDDIADYDGYGLSEDGPGGVLSVSQAATLKGVTVPNGGNVVASYAGDSGHLPSVSSPQYLFGVPLNLANGFAGAASDFQFNGVAAVNGSILRLTDGGQNEASSAFFRSILNFPPPAGVWCYFDFRLTGKDKPSPDGEGFTFVLQDAGLNAVGSAGAGLGYGSLGNGSSGVGIPNSIAVKFDLYNNAGEGTSSTGVYINGATPTVPAIDLLPYGIDLHSGHVFHVQMAIFDGKNNSPFPPLNDPQIYLIITDTVTKASYTNIFTFPFFPDPFLSDTFYFGFTASTGTATAVQDILNWRLSYGQIQ